MPSDIDIQFKLRLPLELKQMLDESASSNGRTLTAEIVHRLELTFDHPIDPEEIRALAAGMTVGYLEGITDSAPPGVGTYLAPIVNRIGQQMRKKYVKDDAPKRAKRRPKG